MPQDHPLSAWPWTLDEDPDFPGEASVPHRDLIEQVEERLELFRLQQWAMWAARDLAKAPSILRFALAVKGNSATGHWETTWRFWLPGDPVARNPEDWGLASAVLPGPWFYQHLQPHGITEGQWNNLVDTFRRLVERLPERLFSRMPTGMAARFPGPYGPLDQVAQLFGGEINQEPTRPWCAADFSQMAARLLDAQPAAKRARLRGERLERVVPVPTSPARPTRF